MPALLAFSALNLGLRLWDSAEATWIWLLPGSLMVGAGIIAWSHTRPGGVGWMASKGVLAAWLVLPWVSIGFVQGRAPSGPVDIPDSAQAAAAAVLIGMCVAPLAVLWRDRLMPAASRHRITVDLYASPMLEESTTGYKIAAPPESDGYYQARCRCGWRGPTRLIEVDTAETDATADATQHLAEPAVP